VEIEPQIGLRFVELADRIEDALGVRTEVVLRRAIKPRHWEIIKGEWVDVPGGQGRLLSMIFGKRLRKSTVTQPRLKHDTFIKDDKTIDSVVRNLEIIGEAANRLPENFKAQRSEIEWRKIIGLRNRIVHDYFNIDVEIV
jgi:hypothetical protein